MKFAYLVALIATANAAQVNLKAREFEMNQLRALDRMKAHENARGWWEELKKKA